MIFKINWVDVDFNINTKIIDVNWKKYSPNVRTFWDMKDLYKKTDEFDDNKWLYFMYRWVYLNDEDKKFFEEENNMRYDVTILIPELISDEYNKTYWHYHPVNNSWNRYQELYQVLSWSAAYLQQNDNQSFFTNAFEWDSVVMEEWFWHVTVNPSTDDYLVMANIVDNNFDSEYWEYKENKWANHYYYTTWFEINPNYKNELIIQEKEEYFEQWDIYSQFLENPDKFNFLH